MNKNIVGAIIAIVAVAGIFGVVAANNPNKSNNSSQTGTTGEMAGMEMNNNEEKSSASGVQDLTAQTEIAMDIKEFEFSKNNIKVSKGTKVTWTNQDQAKHNAFGEDPNGPKGPLLDKGESYSFTFNTAGTFNYICEPHPYMKGVVDVVE